MLIEFVKDLVRLTRSDLRFTGLRRYRAPFVFRRGAVLSAGKLLRFLAAISLMARKSKLVRSKRERSTQ
jgi:hypothetical protein